MLTTLALFSLVTGASASSHREAPAISLDPSADITDFYGFIDPNDTSKVVFIMNVNPLEAPGGGPNFHRFDDNVLYTIHIDNEGDGEEDIDFNFEFTTTFTSDAFGYDTFIYNIGDVATRSNIYQQQSYTVTRVDDGVATVIGSGDVAPINVGTQSGSSGYDPESSSLSHITSSYITSSGDYSFFAGPRQEGFYVDLERTFDLLNLAGADGTSNQNTLLGYNVHSIAIELPITMVTKDGMAASHSDQNAVIAAWTTTSRRAVTVRRSTGTDTASRGGWVQVARLGNPLVNEVVIPNPYKDVFNASHPRDDIQFLSFVQTSLLGAYMNVVLGTSCPSSDDEGLGIGGREDLILAFLTGHSALGTMPDGFALGGSIPGEAGKSFAAFEALRINLAGDGFGQWPDGRNVSDDVTDTALSAVCGLLVDGTTISDGVGSDGLHYLDSFPFLGDPWAGDDHPAGNHDL
jgi:hypothetical protein